MIIPPKTRAEAEKYKYGSRFQPSAYKPEQCAYEVYAPGRFVHSYQCTRKPGYGPDGLYCKQHDPAEIERRIQSSNERYKQQLDARMKPHEELAHLREVNAELLEALKTARKYIAGDLLENAIVDVERDVTLGDYIDAAIAKAKGEEK